MSGEKSYVNAVSESAFNGNDMDDAAALVGVRAHPIDPLVEKRVRRKIDLFFMPTFIVGYGLVYYDKVGRLPKCSILKPAKIQHRLSWAAPSSLE